MVCYKVRIRFRKAGDLRLVSHHDLMRCFERMLRRADVPFQSTQGFNPRPRLVFALSLPLGIVGHEEIVDLKLTRDLAPEDVHTRLTRQAPAGLEILSVQPLTTKGSPQVRSVSYRLPLPAARREGLSDRVAALLAAPEHWIERTRPQPRRLDLRPYLSALRIRDEALEMELLVTPQGTARPDEVLEALGLGDLLSAGAVLERTRLELHPEKAPPAPPAPRHALAASPAEPAAAETDTAWPGAAPADAPPQDDSQEGNT